jgi:putative ABC transport system permease protein
MNASGLLLTRAWSRARELSLRSALGAGRSRIVFTLLGESVLLAALGGVLGLWLGVTALDRAFQMAPPEIRSLGDVQLNTRVVLAAVGISLFAAMIAGLLPALKASNVSLSESLKEGGQSGQGRSATRLRQGLVVTEIAFSLALLVGAGLAVSGFQKQMTSDPGFDADNMISFTLRLPGTRYGEDALVDDFYERAVESLERHPGILAATSTSSLPLGAGGSSLYRSFIFDGAVEPPEGAEFGAMWVEVDPGYFSALGVQPRMGREVTPEDHAGAPLVAVVNQRMADQMAQGESILGRRIRSFWDENLPRTVIGVVDDIQFNGVSREQKRAVVFVPRAQAPRLEMAFLVRTAGDPSAMIPIVRQAITELDGDIALDELQSLKDAHAADLAGIRFVTSLFASFGFLALILAVSGVYGLVAYSVSQRTQEIGVRMAMGATTGTVRRTVLKESARLAAMGLSIGLVLAYGAARVLSVAMNGIAVVEPMTFIGVAALLGVAVLVATWIPATRATRVDPVEALRTE